MYFNVRDCIYIFAKTIFLQIKFMVNLEHFIPYFFSTTLCFMQLFLKILSRMANCVDPDQTPS